MKRFIAILLAILVICSLSVSAFAKVLPAGSTTETPNESPTGDDNFPDIRWNDPQKDNDKVKAKSGDENLYEIRDRETDELIEKIPGTLIAIADAEGALSGSDLEGFKADYEAAQGYEGVVKHFFWLDIGDYVVAPENYLAFNFDCEGENVRVFCNGEEVEVVEGYTAKLPSGGSIAIVTD